MIYEVTVQFRVADFERGRNWYQYLLKREPDFVAHDGFAEWELIPGSWLQVAEGASTEGNGPLRLGVTDIELERDRVVNELNVELFEVYSREGVPAKWGTFSDPWGNRIGFFEYLDAVEKEKTIQRILKR
jgi:hypothetical protein